MNNAVFGRTMRENIEILNLSQQKDYLVSEPNYHIITFFTEN